MVSIAAGIRLAVLAEALGDTTRLVRVMPNTPCLVGQGAAGYCLGGKATTEDGKLVGQLLGAVGVAFQVEEHLLDAVTGLSGSGPAFVYLMIEAAQRRRRAYGAEPAGGHGPGGADPARGR